MEDFLESPEGYEPPEKYEISKQAMVITGVGLTVLIFAITRSLQVQYSIPDRPVSFLVALIFAFAGSGFLHESAHFVMADYLDCEPNFVWPNLVEFGIETLPTKEAVASLLAPQLLSVGYVALIIAGVIPSLEVVLVYALVLNVLPAAYDVSWAIRRLTWPRGTIVLLHSGENYVAFPKE